MPDKRGMDECTFYSLSLSAGAEQNIKQWKQAMFELSLSAGGILRHGCWGSLAVIIPLHASLSNTKAASFFIPLTHAFLMQQFKPSAYSCALTWHLPQIPAQRLSQLARGSQWSCGVITGWVWPCCPCLFCLWHCSINKQRFLQLYILYQYWNEWCFNVTLKMGYF